MQAQRHSAFAPRPSSQNTVFCCSVKRVQLQHYTHSQQIVAVLAVGANANPMPHGIATVAAIAPANLRISRTVQPRPTSVDSHTAMRNFAASTAGACISQSQPQRTIVHVYWNNLLNSLSIVLTRYRAKHRPDCVLANICQRHTKHLVVIRRCPCPENLITNSTPQVDKTKQNKQNKQTNKGRCSSPSHT